MGNLKVAQKLALGFGIAIILAIVLSAIAIWSALSIDNSYTHLLEYPKQRLEILHTINNDFSLAKYSLAQMNRFAGMDGAEANIESQRVEIERIINELKTNLDLYIQKTQTDAQYTDSEKEARVSSANYIIDFMYRWLDEAVYPITQANIDGDRQAVMEISSRVAPMSDELFGSVEALMIQTKEFADKVSADASASAARSTVMLIIIAVVIVISSGIFATIITVGIVRPLKELTGFMDRASSTGDITLRVSDVKLIDAHANDKDEIGKCIASSGVFIKRILEIGSIIEQVSDGDLTAEIKELSDKDLIVLDMQKMTGNLNAMFLEISMSAGQVSAASHQVADGAQALAQGATEQAATIEELSSSVTEIAQRTKENAATADKTATLSETIKQSAEKGSRQMDSMMEAVKEINDASQSISKIIKTIDDIAFQTNILALNAAVEAARAGSAGKGFAVVAEEVRNLASKSADAAKDTGTMIQNSMEKAELGSRITEETAVSLTEIVTGINESSQMISEIARSSEDQSLGIEQINEGINQVAQVVQQNAATAQQSAAASQQMSGQSALLKEQVSRFKLKEDATKQLQAQFTQPPVDTTQAHMEMPIETEPYAANDQPGDFGKY